MDGSDLPTAGATSRRLFLQASAAVGGGLMLGLGETEPEVLQAMDDLRTVEVQVLTIGQYLRPSPQHLPVVAYIPPNKFEEYRLAALAKGFVHVASGPLVRSSYHAAEFDPGAKAGARHQSPIAAH